MVLVRDPEFAVFEPRYIPNYRVTAIYGKNRIEVQDEKGNKSVRRAGHVKLCKPAAKVCYQLPPQEVYEQYGRMLKLLIHPKDVPSIPFEVLNGQRLVKESKNLVAKAVQEDLQCETVTNTFDESRNRIAKMKEDLTTNQNNIQVCSLDVIPEEYGTPSLSTSKSRNSNKEHPESCFIEAENTTVIDPSDESRSRLEKRAFVKNRQNIMKSPATSTSATSQEVDCSKGWYTIVSKVVLMLRNVSMPASTLTMMWALWVRLMKNSYRESAGILFALRLLNQVLRVSIKCTTHNSFSFEVKTIY